MVDKHTPPSSNTPHRYGLRSSRNSQASATPSRSLSTRQRRPRASAPAAAPAGVEDQSESPGQQFARFKNLLKPQLQEQCRSYGLKATGKKDELLLRLKAYLRIEDAPDDTPQETPARRSLRRRATSQANDSEQSTLTTPERASRRNPERERPATAKKRTTRSSRTTSRRASTSAAQEATSQAVDDPTELRTARKLQLGIPSQEDVGVTTRSRAAAVSAKKPPASTRKTPATVPRSSDGHHSDAISVTRSAVIDANESSVAAAQDGDVQRDGATAAADVEAGSMEAAGEIADEKLLGKAGKDASVKSDEKPQVETESLGKEERKNEVPKTSTREDSFARPWLTSKMDAGNSTENAVPDDHGTPQEVRGSDGIGPEMTESVVENDNLESKKLNVVTADVEMSDKAQSGVDVDVDAEMQDNEEGTLDAVDGMEDKKGVTLDAVDEMEVEEKGTMGDVDGMQDNDEGTVGDRMQDNDQRPMDDGEGMRVEDEGTMGAVDRMQADEEGAMNAADEMQVIEGGRSSVDEMRVNEEESANVTDGMQDNEQGTVDMADGMQDKEEVTVDGADDIQHKREATMEVDDRMQDEADARLNTKSERDTREEDVVPDMKFSDEPETMSGGEVLDVNDETQGTEASTEAGHGDEPQLNETSTVEADMDSNRAVNGNSQVDEDADSTVNDVLPVGNEADAYSHESTEHNTNAETGIDVHGSESLQLSEGPNAEPLNVSSAEEDQVSNGVEDDVVEEERIEWNEVEGGSEEDEKAEEVETRSDEDKANENEMTEVNAVEDDAVDRDEGEGDEIMELDVDVDANDTSQDVGAGTRSPATSPSSKKPPAPADGHHSDTIPATSSAVIDTESSVAAAQDVDHKQDEAIVTSDAGADSMEGVGELVDAAGQDASVRSDEYPQVEIESLGNEERKNEVPENSTSEDLFAGPCLPPTMDSGNTPENATPEEHGNPQEVRGSDGLGPEMGSVQEDGKSTNPVVVKEHLEDKELSVVDANVEMSDKAQSDVDEDVDAEMKDNVGVQVSEHMSDVDSGGQVANYEEGVRSGGEIAASDKAAFARLSDAENDEDGNERVDEEAVQLNTMSELGTRRESPAQPPSAPNVESDTVPDMKLSDEPETMSVRKVLDENDETQRAEASTEGGYGDDPQLNETATVEADMDSNRVVNGSSQVEDDADSTVNGVFPGGNEDDGYSHESTEHNANAETGIDVDVSEVASNRESLISNDEPNSESLNVADAEADQGLNGVADDVDDEEERIESSEVEDAFEEDERAEEVENRSDEEQADENEMAEVIEDEDEVVEAHEIMESDEDEDENDASQRGTQTSGPDANTVSLFNAFRDSLRESNNAVLEHHNAQNGVLPSENRPEAIAGGTTMASIEVDSPTSNVTGSVGEASRDVESRPRVAKKVPRGVKRARSEEDEESEHRMGDRDQRGANESVGDEDGGYARTLPGAKRRRMADICQQLSFNMPTAEGTIRDAVMTTSVRSGSDQASATLRGAESTDDRSRARILERLARIQSKTSSNMEIEPEGLWNGPTFNMGTRPATTNGGWGVRPQPKSIRTRRLVGRGIWGNANLAGLSSSRATQFSDEYKACQRRNLLED